MGEELFRKREQQMRGLVAGECLVYSREQRETTVAEGEGCGVERKEMKSELYRRVREYISLI